MPPAQPFLSKAVPRPNQDHDRERGEQPDTPLRPRPWMEGVLRHRLLRLLQMAMAFLLIVAAGSWLFIQTDHDLGKRAHSRAKTRYMLPDGSLTTDRRTYEHASRYAALHVGSARSRSRAREGSLFQDTEFGLNPYSEDYDSDSAMVSSMRKRWIDIVKPTSAQTVVFDPPFINKSTSIVVLTPRCCEDNALGEEDILQCYRNIMADCPALAPSECFLQAARRLPCRAPQHQRSFRLSYLTAIQWLVPYLQELGWSNIQVHRSFLDGDSSFAGSPHNGTCDTTSTKEAAVAAVKAADIVITDAAVLNELFTQFPRAQFVVVEGSESAAMPPRVVQATPVVEHSRVLSIWRSQVLDPADLQNGPLVAGLSHLAFLPGASRLPSFRSRRTPPLLPNTLARLRPLLSHAFRYRYPLECGGNLEHLRFVGAFLQNFSHWQPPRHAQRSIDVAFVGPTDFPDIWPERRPEVELLNRHRRGLSRVLQKLQRKQPNYSILSSTDTFEHYHDHLSVLRDVKIVVSPYGAAEWSHSDLEAVLCGCLLVKVHPASFAAFPDVFRATKHVLRAMPDWTGLEDTLLSALQDKVHTQRMADRAVALLLEYSDMRRYAGEVDDNLSVLVRWWLQKLT